MKKETFSAKTQEDALALAAQQFQMPAEDIEYEVIESGSKGLFGIGTKDSVIEAWVQPENLVKAFLTNLLEKMGFPTTVECHLKEDGLLAEDRKSVV